VAAGIILASSLLVFSCAEPSSAASPAPAPSLSTGTKVVIDYMEAKAGDIILSDGKICKPEILIQLQ